MGTGEWIDRIMGFMPQREVFWTALFTALLIIVSQYIYEWLVRITLQPWMYDHNQQKRKELIEKQKKNRESTGE
ncbi:hypothetical protein [Alteribacter populi]|uniref:hypothetical protein n=1 Tax=Alteribacter populi TaxID=2011011 RepID=UPI000BBAAD86|nr:hypothetical protein [Alteribacter populi]